MDNSVQHPVTWLGPAVEVAEGLAARAGYVPERARQIAAEIERLDPSLHEAFRAWWGSGGIPVVPEIHGHTPASLIEKGKCQSVPVAFTWLSALISDPQRTLERIHATYDIITADPVSDLTLKISTIQ